MLPKWDLIHITHLFLSTNGFKTPLYMCVFMYNLSSQVLRISQILMGFFITWKQLRDDTIIVRLRVFWTWWRNTVGSKHLQQKTQGSWHLSRSMPPLSVSNASLFPSKWWMLCHQSVSCGACIWLNRRIICVQNFFLCWWRLWYQFPFWKLLLPISLESTVWFPATTEA
jgi:hypothetical protein